MDRLLRRRSDRLGRPQRRYRPLGAGRRPDGHPRSRAGRGQVYVPAGAGSDVRLCARPRRGETPPKDLPNEYNVATNFELNMQVPNGHTIKLITAHGARRLYRGRAWPAGGQPRRHPRQVRRTPEGRSPGKGLARRRRLEALSRQDRPPHPAQGGGHMANFFECVKDRSLPDLRRLYPRQHDERPAHVQHRHAAWAGKSDGTRT